MSTGRRIVGFALSAWLLLAGAVTLRAEQNALAILNFRPTNFEAMGYNGEILYALISALERHKKVELMPRREMEDSLYHAGLVQGDTPEMAREAGKVLGIQFILFGNVTKQGSRITANLSLLDVQNKQVLKSWTQTYGSREDILGKIPDFAAELADTIGNRDALVASGTAARQELSGPEVSVEEVKASSREKSVMVNWKLQPDGHPVAGFNVYRADSADGPFQFQARTEKPVYEDMRIKKGREYYYRVGVLLQGGTEIRADRTAKISKAGEKLPHPPLLLGGSGHIRRALIKFVPSLLNDQDHFTITDYKVYRRTRKDDPWAEIATISAKITSQSELGLTFEDTATLEDGQTLFYAISSLDRKKRESPISDTLSITTAERPVFRVARENLLRKVDFSWDPVEQAEGYYLYRRQGPDPWEKVEKIRGFPQLPYTDDRGLEDGRVYAYYLTAYDAKGESGPSETQKARTKDLPPYPEDVIAESGRVKSVYLSWTPNDDPDVAGYAIYRGEDRSGLKQITKVRGHASRDYLDKGFGFSSLEDGKDYFYRISAFNLFGAEGEKTEAVLARTKPRPGAATGLALSAGPDHILVRWARNPEPDVSSYILYRSRNSGGWSKVDTLDAGRTEYTDADLKPESEYRYRIIVEDRDGLVSDPAESDAIQSPLAPPQG